MFEILLNHYPVLLKGLTTTLVVSLCAIALGLVLGVLLAFGLTSRYRLVRWPCGLYRSFWRGTPILLQLLLVYYLLPEIGIEIAPISAAILTLTLNTTAFQAEIFRSGISHIPAGQIEAARMAGISAWQTRRRIIMPQVLRLTLPPLTNEIITILKNSSLISVIAVTELMRVSEQIASRTFQPLETYLAAAVLYLAVNLVLARISAYLERRMTGGLATE
ncbi:MULTISPECIES: amino acid ABC transporter permease [Halomonadaceae]|uniref:amino acid ABC transporter permease n=1 Tax=Halomonadaceae TaxID=28256 RepID=UPI001681276A|nr:MULTISPECIES: amino acid ABC transporter permease [Halomonas]MCA8863051.1 amino acid ABC transporter permease [Halomonas sp. SBBP1]QNU64319.1 amino acid ABC transporter permease [Halomonas titanicae]UZH09445.1 amino acid ABC transporter permease [Halomonas sp. BDJS001]